MKNNVHLFYIDSSYLDAADYNFYVLPFEFYFNIQFKQHKNCIFM